MRVQPITEPISPSAPSDALSPSTIHHLALSTVDLATVTSSKMRLPEPVGEYFFPSNSQVSGLLVTLCQTARPVGDPPRPKPGYRFEWHQ